MTDACEHTETEMRREWVERWFSPSRLSSYLDLCGGDVELALELHEWNLMLGRALMGDIAHSELALRNAYDRALTERFEGLRRELTRDAPHHAKEQGEKTARREHGEPPSHRRCPWAGARPGKLQSGDRGPYARLLGAHDRPQP